MGIGSGAIVLGPISRIGTAPVFAGEGRPERSLRQIAISASVYSSILPRILISDSAAGFPLADSQSGSLFKDGGDESLNWYLPAYYLADDPDLDFSFAAARDGVDGNGKPFNRATATFGLRKVVPSEVQTAQAEARGERFQEIPVTGLAVSLVLAAKAPDGSVQQMTVPGQVAPSGDHWAATVPGLLGPSVLLAFSDLTAAKTASMQVQYSYDVARYVHDELGTGGRRAVVIHETAIGTTAIAIASKYSEPSYLPRYTLSVGGNSHTIVSAEDLEEFNTPQSEYVELTALGNVASKYPSLRALYLGRVSGTVVAVPAAYGIERTSAGCSAACDAVVDTSQNSASGCRFHLSFILAPVIDPGELARLLADLQDEPTLGPIGPRVHLTLPTDLDRRTPSTLGYAGLANLTFGVSPERSPTLNGQGNFLVTLDLVDDSIPAIVKTNLFLSQLATTTVPSLVGRLALRLDDVYEPTVTADVVLSLGSTGGSDDVAAILSHDGSAMIKNQSPLDIRLLRSTIRLAEGFTVSPVDHVLPAGDTFTLIGSEGARDVLVDRTLAVPDHVGADQLGRYVKITTESVIRSHHVFGFNAVGQLAGIRLLEIQIALNAAPEVSVPKITLTPDHEMDSTGVVEVPVALALQGLLATLSLMVTYDDPAKSPFNTKLQHDFMNLPILTVTANQLRAS